MRAALVAVVPVVLVVGGARPLAAQQGTPLPRGALDLGLNDSTSKAIAAAMAQDLVQLKKAEATYYTAHHAYAYAVADLAPFKPSRGTVIVIMPGEGNGYRAVATNPALSGAEFEADVPAPQ